MDNLQYTEKNILPKPQFLDRLRIEKRRADRSKSPLSVALLSFHKEESNGNKLIEKFLKSLQRNTRETDIKGWVDHNVIGLILPDTNEKGVERIARLTDKMALCHEPQLEDATVYEPRNQM